MVIPAANEFSLFSTTHRREFFHKNNAEYRQKGPCPPKGEMVRMQKAERQENNYMRRQAQCDRQRPLSACDMKGIAVLAMSRKHLNPSGAGVTTSIHTSSHSLPPRPQSATLRSTDRIAPETYIRNTRANGSSINNRGTGSLLVGCEDPGVWGSHTRTTFVKQPPYVARQAFKANGDKYQIGGRNIIQVEEGGRWVAAGGGRAQSHSEAVRGFSQATVNAARQMGVGGGKARRGARGATVTAYSRSISRMFQAEEEPFLNPTPLTAQQGM